MAKFNWMNFLGKTMSAAGNAFSGNQGNQMQGGMQGGMMDQGQMTPGQMLGTGIGRMVNSFMENRKKKRANQQNIVDMRSQVKAAGSDPDKYMGTLI